MVLRPTSSTLANGRFALRRRLGAGSYGEVFEAYDERRDAVVALKALTHAQPDDLYRFKQEFRSLLDVAHPNLATLYELFVDGERWFFTMEYVPGTDFLAFVGRPPEALGTRLGRLLEATRQLVNAVHALHRVGRLHCDLKPSNVHVTPEGQVKVLDFGLVRPIDATAATPGGTPAYVSPEQLAGETIREPSDWYAVGTMVFQALTGRLPFEGTLGATLLAKQTGEPPTPRALVPDVPEGWSRLVAALLCREPAERPTAPQILDELAALGAEPRAADEPASLPPAMGEQELFVGRGAELEALRRAAAAAHSGQPVVALVSGLSGMGKTALVRHFLADLHRRLPRALILDGRCHVQESVPYKGFDEVVDALSRYLQQLPPHEAAALLPWDIAPAERLFPVLAKARGQRAKPGSRVGEPKDNLGVRRRAFAALRDLLHELAAQRPVVIAVDDLQWGDRDLGVLLGELLQPPQPPPILFVGMYRSDEVHLSPLLTQLEHDLEILEDVVRVHRVDVRGLAPDEVRELSARLVDDPTIVTRHEKTLVEECEGSPLFVGELVGHLQRQEHGLPETTLAGVLAARHDALEEGPRRLLQVVAVAGHPIASRLALAAADVNDGAAAVASLHTARLLRVGFLDGEERLEPYHDRFREAVVARCSAQTRTHLHGRLAGLMEGGPFDPEILAQHLLAAGHPERARPHVMAAAARAVEKLAFNRAAGLYSKALELGVEAEQRSSILTARAEALANAGNAQAGEAYLSAAEAVAGSVALDLRRCAFEQLLRAGRYDRGLEIARQVFGELGMRIPRSHAGTVLEAGVSMLRLRLHSLRYRERPERAVPEVLVQRCDAVWSLRLPLQLVDPLLSFVLAQRSALLALRVGEPFRVAMGLAVLGLSLAIIEPQGSKHRRFMAAAQRAAERAGTARAFATMKLAYATAALMAGKMTEALELARETDRLFRTECHGAQWELSAAMMVTLGALHWTGRLAEIDTHLPGAIREAEQRGDLFTTAGLAVSFAAYPRLAADEPDRAEQRLENQLAQWGSDQTFFQHVFDVNTRVVIGLYRGQAREMVALIDRQWPALERAHTLDPPFFFTELLAQRIISLIGMMAQGEGEQAALAQRAGRDIDALARCRILHAPPIAQLLSGCLKAEMGHAEEAIPLLEKAERLLCEGAFALHAAAAQSLRGQLMGGDKGAHLVQTAHQAIVQLGIRNPARMLRVYAPSRHLF